MQLSFAYAMLVNRLGPEIVSYLRICGLIAALCGGFLLKAYAQEDTLSTDEIIVTDSLMQMQENALQTKTFSADSLGNFATPGLDAVSLLGRSEGLYIQDYGGRGGVKTVSLRGFASNQTAVTINGVPYANPNSGAVNFAGLNLPGLEAVSVSPSGGGLAQNLLGGGVNLETLKRDRLLKLHAGYGAFGLNHAEALISRSAGRLAFTASAMQLRSEENYAYDINEMQGEREHARFSTRQYMLRPFFRPDSVSHLEYFALGRRSRQQVPGAIVKGNAFPGNGFLEQDALFHYARYVRRTAGNDPLRTRRLAVVASHQYDFLSLEEKRFRDVYTNHQALLQWQSSHSLGGGLVKLLGQGRLTHIAGNNLGENLNPIPYARREELNLAASDDRALWTPYGRYFQYLYLRVRVRLNITNQYPVLPNAGVSLAAVFDKAQTQSAYLRAGHSHRLPAFNELYYFNFGNSDLQPEEAESIDLGYLGKFNLLFPFSLKINGFLTRTQNKIISVPQNPVRWSTIALGLTNSRGVSASVVARPFAPLSVYANFTALQARDFSITEGAFLPYTPNLILAAGADFAKNGWRAGAHVTGVSRRYASLQNDFFNRLDGYVLLDVYAGKIFSLSPRWKVELEAAARNLNDANYAVIRSFPMPGRSWRVRAGLIFN